MRRLQAVLAGALALAVSLPSGSVEAQAQRQAPSFTLKNEGDVTVYALYVARGGTGGRDWGPDRLGNEMIPAGRSFVVRLPTGFGCSADIRIVFDDGGEDIRERVDICREREVVAARSAPAAVADRDVDLVNAGPRTIMFLYIRPAGGGDWLEDRLGQSVFPPGSRFTAQVPDQGCAYDVRVEYDNEAAEERYDIDLCAVAPLTIAPGWTVTDDLAAFVPGAPGPGAAAGGRSGQVMLVNRSGRTLYSVYVFPDGARDEGEDRLGVRMLSDGETIPIAIDQAQGCSYTVRVNYDDGRRDERAGIDLCRRDEVVIEPGWLDAPVDSPARVVNAGSAPIIALYADPAGADRGPDRLGDQVLGVGRALPLAPPQEGVCAYEVTARFRDGREVRVSGADLCGGGEILLAP